jgi:exodeoxyribonuclease VII large subunit
VSARPEPIVYGDRKVYRVSDFNRGVASYVARLPTLWVEGEITELRRQDAWQSVFFTLKDPYDGACLAVSMPRGGFDALRLDLADGALVHVQGRAELWAARGVFQLRALTIEPVGQGAVLLRLDRLKQKLAAEGLFAAERKRPLPFLPALIGLVTGSDAAAKQDVIATIQARFPPARIVVAEAPVQGPRAPDAIARAVRRVCQAGADVIVLARGGGGFDDLLPFSDERLLRAIAACPVPVVSAVGHEQDMPLCDLVADARASTPTAAARMVVPDLRELLARLRALRASAARAARSRLARAADDLMRDRLRLARAPALLLERRRALLVSDRARLGRAAPLVVALGGRLRALSPLATLQRGYAIVRREGLIVRRAGTLAPGERVAVQLAAGAFGARVEDVSEES